MKSLRQQMTDAMVLRGFAARTQEAYLACVVALARHYRRPPDALTTDELQAYLLHLITEKQARLRQRQSSGLRFPLHLRAGAAATDRAASTFPWPKCRSDCRRFSRGRRSRA